MLKYPVGYGAMVPGPTSKSLVMIGGTTGGVKFTTLQQISCTGNENLSCDWQLMKQELTVARESAVAMIIPDDWTDCN